METFNYYLLAFKNWNRIEGCSNRKEFWYFILYNFLISLTLSFFMVISEKITILFFIFLGLKIIYTLTVLIISFTLNIRRLHDINKSGWWLLIGLIPIIGFIILLVFFSISSKKNRYCMN